MRKEIKKEIGKSTALIFCLVLMSSFVLGAEITDVEITPELYPNSDYALIKINATIAEPYQVDYLILHYKIPGSSGEKTALFSNGQMSFSYPNLKNGITFDYQIEISNNIGEQAYTYYPSSTEWKTYSYNAGKQDSDLNNTKPAPITGKATNSGVLADFANTTAGLITIIFVALVLLIIVVRISKSRKNKPVQNIQNTAEPAVQNKPE